MGEADPLCLLTVHAHPDDEASKGAATVARYAASGVRTVLVTCTGGEAGDILNPALDRDEVRARLPALRLEELARSAEAIGFSEVVLLGYRDSGMPETPANEHPGCFARAELGEATGRLVAVLRRERPQVVITYSDDQARYPHPDHLRVHDVSVAAFDAAGDPGAHPELGEPWQPLKLYYYSWSRARTVAVHEKMLELGLESPYGPDRLEGPSQDHRITTRVDVAEWYEARRRALLAHATQISPDSPFWFGLPDDVARAVYPYDDYILARSLVETDIPEDDLFAGVSDLVNR